MSFINKIFQVWHYILGFILGMTIFYFGTSRISFGISMMRISDPEIAHYMSGGLLFIKISLIILVILAVYITKYLIESKK